MTKNLDKGFIELSQSPFVAPILFIKKPNRSLQFCINFYKLNSLTHKDQYSLLLINKTLTRLAKAKIYTKLDIQQAFYYIYINPTSEELMTFCIYYGTYKYKVLPFGLTNRPATYQQYINNVLFNYLDIFCIVYLDDILIYSEDLLKYKLHVRKVLK